MHRVISRSLKIKVLIIFVAISVVCNLCFYALYIWPSHKENVNTTHKVWDGLMKDPVKLQYVVVHIDLKGAPPKLGYLRSLLPMLKDYGVNGLLMEYEDMFPYEGKLVNLRAKNCYERSQLKGFIEIANDLGFEVIPLIQTFGHLEYALKLEEFRQLRENPAHPDSICPSNLESRAMVKEMLTQVIQFHKSISPLKHIHVGCDEVYHLNECEQCKKKLFSNMALFIDYVKYISDLIANLSEETTVLIWDDMLRNISPLAWRKIEFNNVEPVYWHYAEFKKFPHIIIMNYHKKFKNKWIASAFKGADGSTATIPNLHNRVMNHFSWMTYLQTAKIPGEKNVYPFKGIILTGWSRYSHMDPLCELLTVSIPSLIINLRMIRRFKAVGIRSSNVNIDDFYSNYLSENDIHFFCDKSPKRIPSVQYINDRCYFNGHKLYHLLNEHSFVTNEANSFLQHDEILTYEYYLKSNYVNKNLDSTRYNIKTFNDSLTRIHDIEKEIAQNMKKHFEDDVIIEYLAFKSNNLKKKLEHLIQTLETCLSFNGAWGKRPTLEAINKSIY